VGDEQPSDGSGGPDPQHQIAGAIHIGGGAGPNSWIDPTDNYWWDGQQWQPIAWDQAVQVHGVHRAQQWGIEAEEWTKFFHAAWQGVTGVQMTPSRRVELAGAIADSAMHFLHHHGIALQAVMQSLEHSAPDEWTNFDILAARPWIDSFAEALSGHSQGGGADPSTPARQAAADADALLQSQATPSSFQLYHQALHY
jgi:hypothetical protein